MKPTDDLAELAGAGLLVGALVFLATRRAPEPSALAPPATATDAPPLSDVDLALQLAARGTAPTGPAMPLGPLASASMQEALSYDAIQASFDISTVGENTIIPGAHGYRIAVYAFSLWNTVQQDLNIKNGQTVLKALPSFPAQAGYVLSLNQAPHWKLDYNQPLIITLGAGRATGFVKYRMLEY